MQLYIAIEWYVALLDALACALVDGVCASVCVCVCTRVQK